MTIEINGMAHVILTVSRFEVAREFYRKLLPEFGMKPVFDGDKLFYCVGARTAIGIEPCDPARAGERFVQQRVGLHHLCLRARSREDVDECAALLSERGATIVRGPAEDTWAPGYYSVLFDSRCGCNAPRTAKAHGRRRIRARAQGQTPMTSDLRLRVSYSLSCRHVDFRLHPSGAKRLMPPAVNASPPYFSARSSSTP